MWLLSTNGYTAQELICCNKIQSLLVGDPLPTCITMHPDFLNVCLSRTMLTIAANGMNTDATTEPCRDVPIRSYC